MSNMLQSTTTEITPGVRIPLIGLGTWPMVGEEAADAVARAIGHGYRHIDTAENYANEDAVGEGIRRSGIPREDVFVTSKFNKEWHSKDGVRTALSNATRRLGTDYLDLFLVHWPNPDWPAPGQGRFVEACEALQELMDDGAIRAWGVSNFTPRHLRQVQAAGLTVPISQIQLDPATGQREQLAFHRKHGIATAAYSPLGRGGDFLAHPAITAPAEQLGVAAGQVVLRWHVQHGRVATPKSASDQRQAQNLDVFGFSLSPGQMAAIDALDTNARPRLDPDHFGH
ncbi:aldo/keto reductase [Arthrobacter silvisoli]|uniref:aldo/keto reductase n=1 Tax=Arthrobacter silvisoli TaxID=2291022 RepID=UPI000E2145F4|nr:aldo/keto reductase [Arthrobacter silvisoli]